MVYEKRILAKSITAKDFILKRVARIYPLHLLTLFLAIPVTLYVFGNVIKGTVLFGINALLLQTLVPIKDVYFSFNGVSWNAADLMLFYVCFPFLVPVLGRLRRKAFTLIMAAIVGLIVISMQIVPREHYHYVFYISPFFRIFDFVLGMYLYKVVKSMQYKPSYRFGTLAEISAVAFAGIWYWFANIHSEALQPYVYSLFLWLPLSLVIVTFYFEAGIISRRVLSTKLMCTLGGLSFSFYMLHHLVIRYLKLANDYLKLDTAVLYSLCFAVALGLAYLSHNYFERLFYAKKGDTSTP